MQQQQSCPIIAVAMCRVSPGVMVLCDTSLLRAAHFYTFTVIWKLILQSAFNQSVSISPYIWVYRQEKTWIVSPQPLANRGCPLDLGALDNAIKVNNISLHRSASLVFTLKASYPPWHTGMWDHVSSLNDICCGGDRGQKFKNNQNKLIPAQTI